MQGMTSVLNNVINMRASALSSTNWNCDVCGERKKTTLQIMEQRRVVRCQCACERKESDERRALDQRKKKIKAIEKLRKYSLMDEKFASSTLAAWDDEIGSEKLKKMVTRYVEKWPEMKENNVGLLIHGSPGIGKTHATAVIANELMEKRHVIVVAVSTIGLLSRIKETFKQHGREAEIDIINSLENASLLILDDLGAEQKTDWSSAMLYQIIDSRYRSGKPLIITTNLELEQLQNKLTQQDEVDRTYDRIVEICLPIEIKGESNRATVAKSKRQQLIDMLKKGEESPQ